MIMSRRTRAPVHQQVDIISSSRYISHVRTHGNRLVMTALQERFVGRNGVLVQADCLDYWQICCLIASTSCFWIPPLT